METVQAYIVPTICEALFKACVCINSVSSSQQPYEVGTVKILTLQMRNGGNEVKEPA